MTTRGGTIAALLAALGRPSWWLLALAGFLTRGGILLFFVAIVTLPSPVAIASVLGPIITPLYLGNVTPTVVLVITSVAVAFATWVLAGSWLAAATEVVLIRDARQAALDEGLPTGPEAPSASLLITRATAAHLLALVPLAIVTAIAAVQIYGVAYRELVNPTDSRSVVVRVILGATAPIAAIVIAWVAGDLIGGLAVRRILLRGEPVVRAVMRAGGDLVRHPLGLVVAPLVAAFVLIVELAAVLAAVSLVWTEVGERLVRPLDEPLATALALLTFGAAWCLALLVTGLIDAWRSAALTFESERLAGHGSGSRLDPGGTIGASTGRRPGDWSADGRSGSL
jgi:hypothetical protein